MTPATMSDTRPTSSSAVKPRTPKTTATTASATAVAKPRQQQLRQQPASHQQRPKQKPSPRYSSSPSLSRSPSSPSRRRSVADPSSSRDSTAATNPLTNGSLSGHVGSPEPRRASAILLAGDEEGYQVQDVLNQLKAAALVPLVEDLADWLNTVLGKIGVAATTMWGRDFD